MLDSVTLVWGWQRGRQTDLIENPESGRKARGPADLDLRRYIDVATIAVRLGDGDGQIQSRSYRGERRHLGQWELDHGAGIVTVMVRDGRLELRASLPKLIYGRNDVVLTAAETRFALEILARLARDLADCELLTLEAARLSRADYCYQWIVPDVATIIEALARAWKPPRKMVARFESSGPYGGRSIVYGYGSPTVLRLYDKGAERHDQGDDVPLAQIGRILRWEVQQRRPLALESTRVDAYSGERMLHELRDPFVRLAPLRFAAPLESATSLSERYKLLAGVALAEHPDLLERARRDIGKSHFYRLRRLMQEAAAHELGEWRPEIPDDLPLAGMAPHREPSFAHTYPTAEELAAAERRRRERADRVLARARELYEERLRLQTRVPDADELARRHRENRRNRIQADNDLIVAQWRAEKKREADAAYARLRQLEEAREAAQLRLELGEYVTRAKGSVAQAVAAGELAYGAWAAA